MSHIPTVVSIAALVVAIWSCSISRDAANESANHSYAAARGAAIVSLNESLAGIENIGVGIQDVRGLASDDAAKRLDQILTDLEDVKFDNLALLAELDKTSPLRESGNGSPVAFETARAQAESALVWIEHLREILHEMQQSPD